MPVTYTNKTTRSVGDGNPPADFNDLDTAMGQARDSITSLEAAPPAHTHVLADVPHNHDSRNDTRYPLIVQHGGTAGTARPAATSVLWIGTVTPTNMTANDLYLGPA